MLAGGPGAQGGGGAAPYEVDILDTGAAGGAAIRGGVLRVGGYLAGVGLGVVSAAILIRYLGPADFGRYMTVISLVTIVAGLSEAGMTNIGVREYSVLARGESGRVLQNLLGLRLVVTVVGVGAAVGFSLVAGYDRTMVLGSAIAGAGVLLAVIQATYAIPLISRLRLGWVTALELLRQGVSVALIVALVLFGASLLPLFAVPIAAGAVALALTLPLVRGLLPFAPAFDSGRWRELLRLTLPFAAATAVGVVYAYLALVLLSLVSTEDETGYFGAAFRIFVVLGGISGPLVSSAFPVLARAARDDRERLRYAVQKLWEIALLLGAGLAVCTVVGAPAAIRLIAGTGFEPSVDILRLQAGALLGAYLVATWGFTLLSLGRYLGILAANSVALVVSAVTTLTLAPELGGRGAALATLLGETSLAVAYGLVLIRARPDLRPSLGILPRAGLASGAAASVLLLPGTGAFVDLVAAVVVYAIAAVVLRAIPREVREALAPWARRGSS